MTRSAVSKFLFYAGFWAVMLFYDNRPGQAWLAALGIYIYICSLIAFSAAVLPSGWGLMMDATRYCRGTHRLKVLPLTVLVNLAMVLVLVAWPFLAAALLIALPFWFLLYRTWQLPPTKEGHSSRSD